MQYNVKKKIKQKGNQFYLETSSKTDKWQYVNNDNLS